MFTIAMFDVHLLYDMESYPEQNELVCLLGGKYDAAHS